MGEQFAKILFDACNLGYHESISSEILNEKIKTKDKDLDLFVFLCFQKVSALTEYDETTQSEL